jgi:predicted negative regulator of RcsB-dependent stress response
MLENLSKGNFKEQFKENKTLRMTTIVVGSIVGLILIYFAYRQFIWIPSNEKSKDAYWTGLNFASIDSVDIAIDELTVAVKKFDGKDGGELAQFVLARQYMEKGEFKSALKELEGVKIKDTYLAVYTLGLQGDCYSEMKSYKDAIKFYERAAKKNENDKTSPEYLFKAALCAEKINDFKKAADLFQQIKDNYLTFSNQKTIDKYIARVKNKTTK